MFKFKPIEFNKVKQPIRGKWEKGMEVEPTSFPFSRLSPSLCVFELVSLSTYLCTTDTCIDTLIPCMLLECS